MRVTYVARSFLDYRVPVLTELNRRLDGQLSFIYNADYVPQRCDAKIKAALDGGAIGMSGEIQLGIDPEKYASFANRGMRMTLQRGILKRIAETKPDVLIGDGFFQWTAFALACRVLHGTPLVVCYERTAHTERGAQWYRRAYRRLAMKFIDAMSCNGQLCVDYTLTLGMPRDRITTGHMVADTDTLSRISSSLSATDRQAIRDTWGNPEVAFIAVGKLNERKGLRQLLRGWSVIEREVPGNWRLVLVGRGEDEATLKALAGELNLKNVIFHGPADYDEIGRFYASADALAMPTLEDNWSLVVPEAMACGLPVLCSVYNGCYPELVVDDVTGWRFDPLDPDDTVRALKVCLDNRRRLREMGQRAKEIVATHSPAHAAQALLDACHIACQRRLGQRHARPARA